VRHDNPYGPQLEAFNMENQPSSRPFTVWLLIVLLILLGVGAVPSGVAFMLAPDGSLIQMPLSNLQNTPFPNFFIPGLLLFTLLGVYPLVVAYSLWKLPAWRWPDILNPFKHLHWSWAATLVAGIIVIIWITVQVTAMTVGFLHVLYYGWGTLIVAVALLPGVRVYCRLKS
jgi:hypothetical protein